MIQKVDLFRYNFLNATYHIHSDIYEPYVYPNCYIGIKYDGTLCDLYIEAVVMNEYYIRV